MFNGTKTPETYGLTFKGKRNANQDKCLIYEKQNVTFLAVADGMGGMAGGETASKIVIQSAQSVLDKTTDYSKKNLKPILAEIFSSADLEMKKAAEKDPMLNGLGSTLSCVLIHENRYACGHIGDSRIYLLNENGIKQLTEDHSYVQKYIKQFGNPAPPEIRNMSNVIYKAVNGEGDEPDILPPKTHSYKLSGGDLILICSDGLFSGWESEPESDFLNIVRSLPTLKDATEQLICNAYYSGSKDNITVVLAAYGDFERELTDYDKDEYPPD